MSNRARGASDHIKVFSTRQEQHYLTASGVASSCSNHFRSALASASTSPLPARQHPIPLPSRLPTPNPSLLSKQTQPYQTPMSPSGYILFYDRLWHVDLLNLSSSCHHESECSITGLQKESLSGIWETVTFLQTVVKSGLPCS